MPFAYYPLYHEFRHAEHQITSMAPSPTAILEAMLAMELPRQNRRSMPFAYYPLYHHARQTSHQPTPTQGLSPTTAFKSMLDAQLISTIHKGRARTPLQPQEPTPYVNSRENESAQPESQRMPGAWLTETENVHLVLQRPPKLCSSENNTALRRPPKLCVSNNEGPRTISQRTPAPRIIKRPREGRGSGDRERRQRHKMLAEELDEQLGEWTRNTRAQRQRAREGRGSGDRERRQRHKMLEEELDEQLKEWTRNTRAQRQRAPVQRIMGERRAKRRSDEEYVGWVEARDLSPSESERFSSRMHLGG
jgi:hypothetical protein